MSFEISCFGLVWDLFQFTIEGFRTIRPISGMDGMGWDGWDGRLSPFDGMLRAPTVLIISLRSFELYKTNILYVFCIEDI